MKCAEWIIETENGDGDEYIMVIFDWKFLIVECLTRVENSL